MVDLALPSEDPHTLGETIIRMEIFFDAVPNEEF